MFASLLEKRVIRDPFWGMWGRGADITPFGDIRPASTETALQLLTVYACVKFISDSIAMLPIEVFRNQGKARVPVEPKPRWLDMPNPQQSRQEFVSQSLVSVLLTGNSYALIIRDQYGAVRELWPLHPLEVVPNRVQIGAPITYEIHQQGVPVRLATANDILHVKGLSLPSDIKGRNPIEDARQSVGIGLSLQQFAKSFFDNGAVVSGVVEVPQGGAIDAEKLRDAWNQFHQGASRAHGLAVLTGGGTYKPIQINPDDAQFLESRNFTGAEIAAGMFGIHPEMVGLTHGIAGGKDITYQNLESRWTELVRRALQPWISRYEFAFSNLLPGIAYNGQYCRFDIDEYLRADIKTRYEAYQVALGGAQGTGVPFLQVDEIRDSESLPPMSESSKPPNPAPPALQEL